MKRHPPKAGLIRATGWATLPRKAAPRSRLFPVFSSRATAESYARKLNRRVVRVDMKARVG